MSWVVKDFSKDNGSYKRKYPPSQGLNLPVASEHSPFLVSAFSKRWSTAPSGGPCMTAQQAAGLMVPCSSTSRLNHRNIGGAGSQNGSFLLRKTEARKWAGHTPDLSEPAAEPGQPVLFPPHGITQT